MVFSKYLANILNDCFHEDSENKTANVWDHSKMTSPQKKHIILDPSSSYVTVSHFSRFTPSLQFTRQLATNFFLDQRP